MHLNLLREIPEMLTGYSDPEGYAPESGPRLDDLDPFRQFDRYRLALESMARMLDPEPAGPRHRRLPPRPGPSTPSTPRS